MVPPSLIQLCCNAIAKHDMIEELRDLAPILPKRIVKSFLRVFDDIQLAQFHTLYLIDSPHDKLFLKAYRNISSEFQFHYVENKFENTYVLYPEKRLHRCCKNFWREWIFQNLQARCYGCVIRVFDLAMKAPHVVTKLFAYDRDITLSILKCFHRFMNIENMDIWTTSNNRYKLDMLLQTAQRYRKLRKLKIEFQFAFSDLKNSLNPFLEYKASVNECISLSFRQQYPPKMKINKWFSKGALHAISGIQFQHACVEDDACAWAKTLSKVGNIRSIKLYHTKNVSHCLLDLIHDAPTTNSVNAMSGLKLDSVDIDIHSFRALQHWRFYTLQHFSLSNINVGDEGAMQLAKHAAFWPIVKKVILHTCHITTLSFIHLLSTMAHGDGCQNLLILDISGNPFDESAMQAIGSFLSSPNVMRKLKVLRMHDILKTNFPIPAPFLHGIYATRLVRLEMQNNNLDLFDMHKILYTIFTNPNSPIEHIQFFPKYHQETLSIPACRAYFTSESAKSSLAELDRDEFIQLYGEKSLNSYKKQQSCGS